MTIKAPMMIVRMTGSVLGFRPEPNATGFMPSCQLLSSIGAGMTNVAGSEGSSASALLRSLSNAGCRASAWRPAACGASAAGILVLLFVLPRGEGDARR